MRFTSERDLVAQVISRTPVWNVLGYKDWDAWGALELDGFFGIPDLVLAFGRYDSVGRPQLRTVAFEIKLNDWKRALSQAYRYRAFAQCSYVVIDDAYVDRALAALDRFVASNIGLISVSYYEEVSIHFRPRPMSPYASQLRERFTNLASSFLFSKERPEPISSSSWSEDIVLANRALNRRLAKRSNRRATASSLRCRSSRSPTSAE